MLSIFQFCIWENIVLCQPENNSYITGITGNTVWKVNLYRDFTIICPTLENDVINNTCKYYHVAEEQPKKVTEEQLSTRKEIRRDWRSNMPIDWVLTSFWGKPD